MTVLGTQAIAQDGSMVAYVFSKRGDSPRAVWIERDGARMEASPGTRLYDGDIIRVRGISDQIVIRSADGERTVVNRRTQPFSVVRPDDPGLFERASQFWDSVTWAFSMSEGHQQRRTAAGRKSEGAENATPHPLLGLGVQVLPEGLTPTIVWCGMAEQLVFNSEGETISVATDDFGIATLTPHSPDGPVTVVGKDGEPAFDYTLEWAPKSSLPRPEWLPDTEEDITDEQRATWGAWLISEADPRYRLAGISILASEQANSLEAAYRLDTVISCPSVES